MPRIEFIVQFDSKTKQIKRICIFCGKDEYNCEKCLDRDICNEIYNAILNTKYATKLRKKLKKSLID